MTAPAAGHRRRRGWRRGAQVLLDTASSVSGRIRVVERGRERRLVIDDEIQSVYFPDGDWSAVAREYWARALAPLAGRRRPRVLLVGLGGGTQVHLLRRRCPEARITVIERDPAVIGVASRWFGLRAIGGLEFLCAEADRAVTVLASGRRRYDYVMDDISYAATPPEAARLAQRLARLVAPGGTLALNQHLRPAARTVAAAVAQVLPRVRQVRVRRDVESVLIFGHRPAGQRLPTD